jgi:hypothetical protein
MVNFARQQVLAPTYVIMTRFDIYIYIYIYIYISFLPYGLHILQMYVDVYVCATDQSNM